MSLPYLFEAETGGVAASAHSRCSWHHSIVDRQTCTKLASRGLRILEKQETERLYFGFRFLEAVVLGIYIKLSLRHYGCCFWELTLFLDTRLVLRACRLHSTGAPCVSPDCRQIESALVLFCAVFQRGISRPMTQMRRHRNGVRPLPTSRSMKTRTFLTQSLGFISSHVAGR